SKTDTAKTEPKWSVPSNAAPPATEAPPPTAQIRPATPDDKRPSPLSPAPAEGPPHDTPALERPAIPQHPSNSPAERGSVSFVSSPGGALIIMDGRADAACRTPCSIDAPVGRHAVSISLAGYQPETREVNVTTAQQELPMIMLRPPAGTLMLTSTPAG